MKKVFQYIFLVVSFVLPIHSLIAATPAQYGLKEGDLVRAPSLPAPDGWKVYIINNNGYKRHIFNPDVFNMYGHLKWSNIKDVSADTVNAFITSDVYRIDGDPRVWSVDPNGVKHWLNMTAEQYVQKGYSWNQIFLVNPREGNYYGVGSDIRFSGISPPPPPLPLDTTAPSISLTSPASGTSYTTAQTVLLAATASDNVGVTKVEFYNGTALKGSDTSSPYNYSWNITSTDNGTHAWTAKAYDAAGNSTVSSPATNLTVAISSSSPPPVTTTDYVIDSLSKVPASGTLITVTGSVIIAINDVTLTNVSIVCKAAAVGQPHSAEGIRAVGVHRLKLRNVEIDGCGRYGVFLQNGTGHDLAEGEIKNIGKEAVVFDNVSESWLIGWELRGGVALKNASHHNRLIADMVVANGQGSNTSPYPYYISADSYANQMVRIRTRDNNKDAMTVLSENPNNLWYQNVCDKVAGFAKCFFLDDASQDGNYGDPNQFSPRIWSICSTDTTGGKFSCDFSSYQQAIGDARVSSGHVLVIDSKTAPGNVVAPITIAKPLWFIGNLMAQKGNYSCEINIGDGSAPGVTVTSPGVRIENVQIDLGPAVLGDTQLINVKVKDSKGQWGIFGIEKPFISRLVPPGC